jgi:predicted HAD superfamily Cof-like phosphohydrolase
MTTAFECVREFHNVMDHPCNDTFQHDVFSDNPRLADLRRDLVCEELSELLEAINDKDFIEIADALADIRYVVVGAFLAFGIHVSNEMEEMENNLPLHKGGMYYYKFYVDNVENQNIRDIQDIQDIQDIEPFFEKWYERFSTYHQMVRDSFYLQKFEIITQVLLALCVDMKEFAWDLGIDLNAVFNEVHRSNMTKVCANEEEAVESVKQLKESGKCDTAGYKKSKCNKFFLIYNEETGKALKSINFELPKIAEILDLHA